MNALLNFFNENATYVAIVIAVVFILLVYINFFDIDLNKPTNWQARLNIKLRVAKTCALINLSLRIDTLSTLTSAKNCCLNRRKEMHKLRLHLSPVCSKHNVRETLTIWRRTSNSWKIGRRKEFKTGGKTTKLELKIKPELSTSKTEKWTFLRLNLKKN